MAVYSSPSFQTLLRLHAVSAVGCVPVPEPEKQGFTKGGLADLDCTQLRNWRGCWQIWLEDGPGARPCPARFCWLRPAATSRDEPQDTAEDAHLASQHQCTVEERRVEFASAFGEWMSVPCEALLTGPAGQAGGV